MPRLHAEYCPKRVPALIHFTLCGRRKPVQPGESNCRAVFTFQHMVLVCDNEYKGCRWDRFKSDFLASGNGLVELLQSRENFY